MEVGDPRILIIGCGAIARELLDVVERNRLDHVDVECLPAVLHNRPERIPAAVSERIQRAQGRYDRVFVGYADCGTGGLLDDVLEEQNVERLPGAHCYEFFAGSRVFDSLQEEEIGSFYLTDYLVRHFRRLVWEGLRLDEEIIRRAMFQHYTRVVYLSQTEDAELVRRAIEAADMLGLDFEHRHVGMGTLEPAIVEMSR